VFKLITYGYEPPVTDVSEANKQYNQKCSATTHSGIDALPSFLGVSTISSPSRFVVEGVFWKSGVVHSFEMVDPVLFVFGFHVMYSRDL
jgi:hypothetical protein